MKAFWDQRMAEHKPLPKGTFQQFLKSETVASAVVQRLQMGLADNSEARATVTERAIGKPLEADDDGTRAARDQVTAMLTTAYCTAMLESPDEEILAATGPALSRQCRRLRCHLRAYRGLPIGACVNATGAGTLQTFWRQMSFRT